MKLLNKNYVNKVLPKAGLNGFEWTSVHGSTLVIYIFVIFLLTSCNNQQIEFDKEKWNERDDMSYANREKMVTDLMETHLNKGMTYREVVNLLGTSENYQNDPPNTIGYEIMVDYGWNIDPQKGKTLYIEFTNDSIVKDIKLE